MAEFPYRYVARTGERKGTTFVYLSPTRVIEYATDGPAVYYAGTRVDDGELRDPEVHDMTPKKLRSLNGIREVRCG
jgi:hypothetical protein